MIASYECELCGHGYESQKAFVTCHGDACHNEVCRSCAKKCKDPDCRHHICSECQDGASHKYMGDYCVHHAVWDDIDGEMVNFDYISKGLTHKQALERNKQ